MLLAIYEFHYYVLSFSSLSVRLSNVFFLVCTYFAWQYLGKRIKLISYTRRRSVEGARSMGHTMKYLIEKRTRRRGREERK
uniref:Uncharacterized protein n=1 Tax=Lepeophtheirus salmonis TaxID=72036 RepID=A0A0K2UBR4_LEPSM